MMSFFFPRKAVLHRKAGQPAEASWRRILTLKRPDQICSVDQGIYGHLTLRNLAVLAEERDDRPKPNGSGRWFSTPARASPRPCRAWKRRSESKRPQGRKGRLVSGGARMTKSLKQFNQAEGRFHVPSFRSH